MKNIFLIILICLASITFSQEVKYNVSVKFPTTQDISPTLGQQMQTTIKEFMDSYSWTDNVFEENERIEISVNIAVTKIVSSSSFVATFQFMVSRPTYNTTYKSQILSFVDEEVPFTFEESQEISFNENLYSQNLTSVLGFYTYLGIAMDYDSFSRNGGTPFYQKAMAVVNSAQSGSNDLDWANSNSEGRYWLIDEILSSQNTGFRECYYKYHRLGLDVMSKDINAGKKAITESLYELEKVFKIKSNSTLLTLFFHTKSKELVSIFSEGQAAEKTEVASLLKKMDPINAAAYNDLQKN
ncbi:MAG: DUF4835 family protein [Bacteroidales bacterium]|nr:DUF4835 family protein [Bacteroidales bacterium]